ncbi:MAG TPA: formylglycine-generating enzyme family protein [Microvirga sp.]|jgi:formylglycine-generating enzyme required for sulfatase activity|nr:formylglycine-generating enzyme family protein [Microvirga sp.]
MSCCIASTTRDGRKAADPDQLAQAAAPAGPAAPRIRFDGGTAFVGTDRPVILEDGEGPRRKVSLRAFALDAHAVTNARFAAFVAATGYVTEAERFGWSTVFRSLLPPDAPHPPSRGPTPWWVMVDGAFWAAPEGPGSTIEDRPDHPVVHLSWADAKAFAAWCGGRLPSEAEWEHAARGGLDDPRFPWGEEEPTDSTILCNIWQGTFPAANTVADGYLGTSPVAAFAPNGAGLFGMAGNVWEWTGDPFKIRSLSSRAKQRNAHALREKEKVLKGGSFLCHRSYCYRYRVAARIPLTPDSAASNVGFRVAYDA